MKQKDILVKAVESYLEGKDLFLVDLTVSSDNDIEVVIESLEGIVSLDDCVDMSRAIEAELDRDVEDFSLTVGSAGLSSPFKVRKQYLKFIESEIEVTRTSGARVKGILENVSEEGITLLYSQLVKREGMKKKERVEVSEEISFAEIKSARPVISFK